MCGFLTEMVANNDGIEAIICGIGINLTQRLENLMKVLDIEQQVYNYMIKIN